MLVCARCSENDFLSQEAVAIQKIKRLRIASLFDGPSTLPGMYVRVVFNSYLRVPVSPAAVAAVASIKPVLQDYSYTPNDARVRMI